MILFFAPGGRVGNLLFQFSFIQSIRKPGEWVVGTQFSALPKFFFKMRGFFWSDSKTAITTVNYVLYPLIYHFMVKPRLISSYMEKDEKVLFRKGILPLTLVGGYFQRAVGCFFPFELKTIFRERPRKLFTQADGKKALFLHIRRGDYAEFKVEGASTLLPFSYYVSCLEYWNKCIHDFHFFIVGDDPDFAENNFSFLPNKTVSRLSPLEDLHLMSLCEGGVISNSSFAWWGAHLGAGRQPVFAPKFWLGWAVRRWIPLGINSQRLTYKNVED